MKQRIFILTCLMAACLVTSCTREVSSREFADRFIAAEMKAWSTGNVDDLKALEDDGVVYHLPGVDVKGWKAHEDYILNGRPTVADLKQNWGYLSGDGKHLVLAYDSSAILKGTDKNPPQAISNNYLFVLRIQGQKVAEVWANGTTTSKPVEEARK